MVDVVQVVAILSRDEQVALVHKWFFDPKVCCEVIDSNFLSFAVQRDSLIKPVLVVAHFI